MKTITFISILLLISLSSGAQPNKNNMTFVRIGASSNLYSSIHDGVGHKLKSERNGALGFFAELGGRQNIRNSNLFFEEAIGFVYSQLPFPEKYTPTFNERLVHSVAKVNEYGFNTSVKLGYNFILKENLNLDLFIGPEARYLINYKENRENSDIPLHKFNLRWKAGIGLNVNNLNINFSANPDLLDRGKGIKRYRTVLLALGVGYYF